MVRPTALTLDPETPFLHDPGAQAICKLLEDAGYQSLFVGGCVRNALMGVAVADLDISTDALPETVIELVEHAQWRAVPTGIDHGTVTVVAHGTPIEVTTFRKDVATDGRRAVVRFATDIKDDAKRRDFTMNALYADIRGQIMDPLGGLPDLVNRRVRFIDDAHQRIREDFLRILRFFRFGAWYGQPQGGWDADALAAISENLPGLETLSAERVTAELLKLLAAPDPTEAVAVMAQTGVLAQLVPGADPALLGPVVHVTDVLGLPPDPVLRLAALGGDPDAPLLRLSRKERRKRDNIAEYAAATLPVRSVGYVLGADVGVAAVVLRSVMLEAPCTQATVEAVVQGSDTVFPVRADDFPHLQGPALGAHLRELKDRWLASDLTLSRSDLMKA